MKKIIFIILSCFIILTELWAQTRMSNPDQELLTRVDATVSYLNTDFQAEYVIVQDRPGQSRSTTVAGVFRRDSREQYVIIIMEPLISRGQGYLKEGNTLWFYDPESRRFNTTSSSSRFQNTNARNSDFTRSTLAQDYRVVSGFNEQLGRFNCRVLNLEAVTNEVEYPIMKVWISTDDNLLRKAEDYSLSGQLLRTTVIADYYQIDTRYVPRQLMYVETLRGATINGVFVNERTQITINRPSFSRIADSVFSQTFLESVSR
ncbi:MAG: outer membrane lipoprotein-sorting protein [Treponema sp.]|nr:outer membrane lipoprotein-sorting protein [Treponema sp.]